MEIYPDVSSLANASEEQLLKIWQGLGYYARARNLKNGAQVVMEHYGGRLPEEREELLKIPGIGPYVSAAIASMAFQKKEASLDGNLYRVLSRVSLWEKDINQVHSKRALGLVAQEMMPQERPGDFNQALMDLGAAVCLANRVPLCEKCPIIRHCKAHSQGKTDCIPVKTKKKPRKILYKTVFLIQFENQVILVKRPDKGLLAGLWEFPNVEGHLSKKGAMKFLKEGGILTESTEETCPDEILEEITFSKHIFSHQEWHMIGYQVTSSEQHPFTGKEPYLNWQWVKVEALVHSYSIPSAFRDYMEIVEGKNI
jgi:A/G-specific adenine glycosylase